MNGGKPSECFSVAITDHKKNEWIFSTPHEQHVPLLQPSRSIIHNNKSNIGMNRYNEIFRIPPLPGFATNLKPKRFFGGLLEGTLTTLEAAIKVNIPIPWCQFPRSPCKPTFLYYLPVADACFFSALSI